LRAIINIARNDKAGAIEAATAATTASPNSFRAWLALSYAQQASFKLEDSLLSARKAQALEPNSSVTNARVAELLMSLGRIKEAEVAARAAVDANPAESRAHTVLGFVRLAQIKTKEARTDFHAAIERDSSDPLPRLGLGLAIIRTGKLADGREQLEIAVALDPTNSLLRSYVGKAYYEENSRERDKLAETQFGLAKELDSYDPTPWFYDAILKQTQNRPVEALENLQKSIERNDNRAPYRSKLAIDQDLASRSAGLARIYSKLGFDQLALIEATKSLSADPASYSAHRLLSDSYANLPRHDIARQSELLQSQLMQPLVISPISPLRTPESQGIAPNAGIPKGITSPSVGVNEFTSLFDRNDVKFFADGLGGQENTWLDQIVGSVLHGWLRRESGFSAKRVQHSGTSGPGLWNNSTGRTIATQRQERGNPHAVGSHFRLPLEDIRRSHAHANRRKSGPVSRNELNPIRKLPKPGAHGYRHSSWCRHTIGGKRIDW
jgi:tetratricopeptide (TPR) repeat protein